MTSCLRCQAQQHKLLQRLQLLAWYVCARKFTPCSIAELSRSRFYTTARINISGCLYHIWGIGMRIAACTFDMNFRVFSVVSFSRLTSTLSQLAVNKTRLRPHPNRLDSLSPNPQTPKPLLNLTLPMELTVGPFRPQARTLSLQVPTIQGPKGSSTLFFRRYLEG